MSSETMTLQQAAQDALDVQDASNLSGVAHSFLAAVQAVNEEAQRLGEATAWRNSHPIIELYVDKLASLCGLQWHINVDAARCYRDAAEECRRLAAGEETAA